MHIWVGSLPQLPHITCVDSTQAVANTLTMYCFIDFKVVASIVLILIWIYLATDSSHIRDVYS